MSVVAAPRPRHTQILSSLHREADTIGIPAVFFSPSHAQHPARELVDRIFEDRRPTRLQIQLHKYLWGDVPAR